jgi:hypothetical protein
MIYKRHNLVLPVSVLVKKLPRLRTLLWFTFCSLEMTEMCHLLILSNKINSNQSASIFECHKRVSWKRNVTVTGSVAGKQPFSLTP